MMPILRIGCRHLDIRVPSLLPVESSLSLHFLCRQDSARHTENFFPGDLMATSNENFAVETGYSEISDGFFMTIGFECSACLFEIQKKAKQSRGPCSARDRNLGVH